MAEALIQLFDQSEAQALFGPHDSYIRQLRKSTPAMILLKGNTLVIQGDANHVNYCEHALNQWCQLLRTTGELTETDVERSLQPDVETSFNSIQDSDSVAVAELTPSPPRNKDIRAARVGRDKLAGIEPRTAGQRKYIKAMTEKSLVFSDGPAGCGKTYLAVAMALQMLRSDEVRKIVLVRPAVEAGEKLGFLPGDMLSLIHI